VTFEVAADAYDRFMGRYSGPLATRFADWARVHHGQRALDVGCGPGALTRVLVDRLGAEAVSAVDPSAPFVAALRRAFPSVDVQSGVAEQLPYPADLFDVVLAQLVIPFLGDPVGGLHEMGRVTRPGGTVAACSWDHAGEGSPLSLFWHAARDLDPAAPTEAFGPGSSEGSLAQLFDEAGLAGVEEDLLTVTVRHETLDDWWEPFTLGVGPAGDYVKALDQSGREALRARCAQLLPEPPFWVMASAWAVRARA
jgi:SAM-dependent methyltransferase